MCPKTLLVSPHVRSTEHGAAQAAGRWSGLRSRGKQHGSVFRGSGGVYKLTHPTALPSQVKRAVDERDETCKKLMEKLQAECSVAAQKADPKRDTAAAVAPSAEDDAGCSVKEAEVGRRLQVLQEATGYHVLASLEIDPVLDAFLSHMVPFEREEVGLGR